MHHLLPEFNVIENVMMPLLIGGLTKRHAQPRAMEMLAKIDLSSYAKASIHTLSTGQRQRVAFARACVWEPLIVFADEPTGSLDQAMTHELMDLCCQLNEKLSLTWVIVTHDVSVSERMDVRYRLSGSCLELI